MKIASIRSLVLALGLGWTLVAAGQAHAAPAMIEHSVNGIIQGDHFENDTVGTAPAAWDITTGVVVKDTSTTPPLGARSKYAELSQTSNDTLGMAFADITGGTLTIKVAFYMVSGTGAPGENRFVINLLEGGGSANLVLTLGLNPGDNQLYNASSAAPLGIFFVEDQWQDLTLVANLGSPAADAVRITINGNTATTALLNTNSIDGVVFQSRLSGGPTVFLAALPEPTSLALLSLGALGLACRPRHGRGQ